MKNQINLKMETVRSLCDTIGATHSFLSRADLTNMLKDANVSILDDGYRSNGLTYCLGLNKRKWLFECLSTQISKDNSTNCVIVFLQKGLSPVKFINNQENYKYLIESINKILAFEGLNFSSSGEIKFINKVLNLDECNKKFNSLKSAIQQSNMNLKIIKYCKKDIINDDYYNIIVEATKGLAEEVREKSKMTGDGSNLFETAFSKNNPKIVLNALKTDTDKNEFNGLKELLNGCFHLFRNTRCHSMKVHWNDDLKTTLKILHIISFLYDYLDICYEMPDIQRR